MGSSTICRLLPSPVLAPLTLVWVITRLLAPALIVPPASYWNWVTWSCIPSRDVAVVWVGRLKLLNSVVTGSPSVPSQGHSVFNGDAQEGQRLAGMSGVVATRRRDVPVPRPA